MIIENSDALKVWLTSGLGRTCDVTLAEYIIYLLEKERKKKKSKNELRKLCLDKLEVFFHEDTKQFVDLLFETIKNKTYLHITGAPLSNTESLNNVTVNSAKKLNSCDGREDLEKDSIKPESVAKSKSSDFTKVSEHVSTEKHALVKTEFPELTPEMQALIDNVMSVKGNTDIVCKTICNNNLVGVDFETLTVSGWLNDNIINSYFELIVERSKEEEDLPSVYAFSTFFYSKLKDKGYSAIQRWTTKIDLFNFDVVFVPLHLTHHWALAVIDHRSKKICYYDSWDNNAEACLDILHGYLCQEYRDKKNQILDPSTYVTETMKSIPKQTNGHDCGMFSLKYAEYISRNAEITFNQGHMEYFRRRMIYELLSNQIL